MRLRLLTLAILVCFGSASVSAFKLRGLPDAKKGSFYLYWGYNRSVFSKSNLHFNGPNYDFTLYDVTASDRPTDLGAVYVKPNTFTIPQYNYRLGYFITNRISISAGMDHMKYVVDENQASKISGVIAPEASKKYQGTYLNHPINITPDLLTFEHSDGFNLASLELEYLQPIKRFGKDNFSFLWNFGMGGVWVITKTKVAVMEEGLDNDFHLSGYAMSMKTGPRIEYKNRFFVMAEIKGGYAHLPDIPIMNAAPMRCDQSIGFFEYYIAAGVNFKIHRSNKK